MHDLTGPWECPHGNPHRDRCAHCRLLDGDPELTKRLRLQAAALDRSAVPPLRHPQLPEPKDDDR